MSNKFQVGQPVIMTRHYGRTGHDEGVVRKVGRQYVYASEEGYLSEQQWRKFSLSDGDESLGGYTGGTLYTLDEWDEMINRGNAVARLKAHGIEVTHRANATLAQLRDMLAILDPWEPVECWDCEGLILNALEGEERDGHWVHRIRHY